MDVEEKKARFADLYSYLYVMAPDGDQAKCEEWRRLLDELVDAGEGAWVEHATAAFNRPLDKPFVHILPKVDSCDHDFQGWRDFPGGGELVCTRCGMGAMSHTIATSLG